MIAVLQRHKRKNVTLMKYDFDAYQVVHCSGPEARRELASPRQYHSLCWMRLWVAIVLFQNKRVFWFYWKSGVRARRGRCWRAGSFISSTMNGRGGWVELMDNLRLYTAILWWCTRVDLNTLTSWHTWDTKREEEKKEQTKNKKK